MGGQDEMIGGRTKVGRGVQKGEWEGGEGKEGR